ncbi:hypothetical protein [Planococcus salinarum]|uniref:hypothetical protein n=1 Tax=Planococcus salinarum TaxID=622695 RepID=UPI000E3DBD4A|nr:hypothetical protein [Planococcus salinarum]TAA73020.1 hypothetical protein D2909_02995 [Planococcus salinarum]
MSNQQSSEQDKNIKKMNELLEEKKEQTSHNQNSNQQEQKNQSLKDGAHTPDENNTLTETKNNRLP